MRYFVIRYHLDRSSNEIKKKKTIGDTFDEESYNELKDLIAMI